MAFTVVGIVLATSSFILLKLLSIICIVLLCVATIVLILASANILIPLYILSKVLVCILILLQLNTAMPPLPFVAVLYGIKAVLHKKLLLSIIGACAANAMPFRLIAYFALFRYVLPVLIILALLVILIPFSISDILVEFVIFNCSVISSA